MNGNSISCLPILPLPFFVKTPANTTCSHGSPTTGSDFPSEHAQRMALVRLMVPTTWRAGSMSYFNWSEELAKKPPYCRGGHCYARGPCKRESSTSSRPHSGPSSFSGNKERPSPAQCGCPTSNKCSFLPSDTILIHFLLNRFIALVSNLSAAATPCL